MKEQEKEYPRVGVGAFILDENEMALLVLRKKSPEAGCWSIPGGRVEFMETIEDALKRELKEELGIKVKIINLLGVTNHIIEEENIHWVSPVFLVKIEEGELKNLAPDETQKYSWFSISNLPENTTITAKSAVNAYVQSLYGRNIKSKP